MCKAENCDEVHLHNDLIDNVKTLLPKEEDLYDLAELFKTFGDSTRIRILFALFESPLCVCDIAEVLNMTPSAISHQLRVLKQAKLVKNRKDGRTVFYFLADDHVKTIINQGYLHAIGQCHHE